MSGVMPCRGLDRPKGFGHSVGMVVALADSDLTAAQTGDVAALNRLIASHRQGVYRYGLHVCRTTEDAEDAVQETLWAATRAIHTFRGTASSIASWLFTIVRRECLRLLERHKREPVSFDDDAHDLLAEVVDPGDALALKR